MQVGLKKGRIVSEDVQFQKRMTEKRLPVFFFLRGDGHSCQIIYPFHHFQRQFFIISCSLRFNRKRQMPFRPLFKRMKRDGLTVHGFRSSFRDWCAEKAHADRELAEAALAHKVGGVEGAYFRSDLFERRRGLMDAWARYATGQSGDVVEFVRA